MCILATLYTCSYTVYIDTYGHAPAEILQATCPGCHARPLWVIYNLYISMITLRAAAGAGAVRAAQSAQCRAMSQTRFQELHTHTHTQTHTLLLTSALKMKRIHCANLLFNLKIYTCC